jgi:hypothetical protein
MKQIKKIIHHLDHAMQRSLSHSAHQTLAVGAIAFFGFPVFYWI